MKKAPNSLKALNHDQTRLGIPFMSLRPSAFPGRWTGFGLILLSLCLFGFFAFFEGEAWANTIWRPIKWGTPALLLIAGGLSIERDGAWPRIRLLENIGDASYSLYLWHGLVIVVFRRFFHLPSFISNMCIFVIAIFVSYASYRFFELPVGNQLKHWLAQKREIT